LIVFLIAATDGVTEHRLHWLTGLCYAPYVLAMFILVSEKHQSQVAMSNTYGLLAITGSVACLALYFWVCSTIAATNG